jgi:hypothetical protein
MPLLAIADTAGGLWSSRAGNAAHALSENAGHDASSTGEMLLPDIQSILDEKLDKERGGILRDRISSAELTNRLAAMEGRPWAEWKSGLPITPNSLARLLRTFGISSATIRLHSGQTLKGFMHSDFDDAFERYGLSQSVTPSQRNNDGHTVTDDRDVTVQKSQKPSSDGPCDGVAVADALSEQR